MSIRLEQPGASKAAATAGAMVGKGERAKEDRARAEQQRQQQEAIAAQQSARTAALEWEKEKMFMRSQQDFAHEMRMKQVGLDKEARAHEWEKEKMELASQNDFKEEEKERIRKRGVFKSGIESIDKNDTLNDTQKQDAKYTWAMKYTDIEEAAQYLGNKPTKETDPNVTLRKKMETIVGIKDLPWSDLVDEYEKEQELGGLSVEDTPGISKEELPEIPEGKLLVRSPDGEDGTIDEGELQEYLTRGFTLIEPTTQEEETVTESEEGGIGIKALLGATPLGALGSYANVNRQVQMDKMRRTKEARKTMSLGERLRR